MILLAEKPSEWSSLPLYKKIQWYGTVLPPECRPYVDKIEAKTIVKQICGDHVKTANVVKILDAADVSRYHLKPNHVLKATHASGRNWFHDPDEADLKQSLQPFSSEHREIQYSYVTPRLFVEEMIVDKYVGNLPALVYMFRCIHNKVVTVVVKAAGMEAHYWPDWTVLLKSDLRVPKPIKLTEMIRWAEILSAPFEFVRIDFFVDQNDDTYFSEFTFTPAGGHQIFDDSLEMVLGAMWK